LAASKPFVRDATGLVRSFSFLDQFLISQAITQWLGGAVSAVVFAPYFFPGANLTLVFALGAVGAVPLAVVYSKLSAAIPRSGGDYVWSTRVLGPVFGSIQLVFLFVTTVITGIFLSIYFAITIALEQLIFSIGVSSNNIGLIRLATSLGQPDYGFAVSIIILIMVTAIALLGLRVYSAFQKVGYIVYYVIAILFFVLLITLDSSRIPPLFDQAMKVAGYNTTYNGVIQQAQASGLNLTGFNLTNSLFAAFPWGFLTFTGFNFGTYLAGETKNVKSSIGRALYLSIFVTVVVLIGFSLLQYDKFGSTFLTSAGYVASVNSGAFPVYLSTNMLISLANPTLGPVVSFGLFLGWVLVCVAYLHTLSRMLFAASFDRLLPQKFADVSPRFHAPQYGIVIPALVVGVYLFFNWYASYASALLNTSFISPIGYMLPLIATLLFYFRKRELFDRTVRTVARPATVIIASLVGVGFFLAYIVAETVPISSGIFVGSSLNIAYGVVAVGIIIGLLIYGSARMRMRKLGIDLGNVYREIPPE
jgi:basic amino acid/polyamine antiporter, APA family